MTLELVVEDVYRPEGIVQDFVGCGPERGQPVPDGVVRWAVSVSVDVISISVVGGVPTVVLARGVVVNHVCDADDARQHVSAPFDW